MSRIVVVLRALIRLYMRRLEQELTALSAEKLKQPPNTMYYTHLNLTEAVWQLKVELCRALLGESI